MKKRSKTLFTVAGAFLVLAAILYSCGGGGGLGYSSSAPPPATSTVQVVPCPASGTTDISIVSMIAGFSPSSISVPVSTTVKWTNIDTILHTVTSTAVPANGTFDVQVNPGTSVCLKYTSAGTYNYHCSIHPTMPVGVVVVQ